MRTAWSIVSMLAVAHMLALIGVVAWLFMTDRVSFERVERLREVLAVSITEEQRLAADAEREEIRLAAQREREEIIGGEPADAETVLQRQRLADEVAQQAARRQRRELEDLRLALLRQKSDLEQREASLLRSREAFRQEVERYASIEGAEQFRTALATLEGQRPRDAFLVLKDLWGRGDSEQVVAYMTRMDEDRRVRVMAEFVKDDPALATDLLERLRTRGLAAADPTSP